MKQRTKTALLVPLIGFLLLPIVGILWYAWGQRSGEEFSPDDFTRRRFSYNRDPIFGMLLAANTRTPTTTGIDRELIGDGWITPRVRTRKTWHLISDSRDPRGRPSAACDARFLTGYLDLRNEDGDDVWSIWNDDHPNLAPLFWPVIAQMARDEMYLLIPDLMNFARHYPDTDVTRFQQRLTALQFDAYATLGKLDFEQGRYQRARDRMNTALAIQPDEVLASLLADCELELARNGSPTEPTGD